MRSKPPSSPPPRRISHPTFHQPFAISVAAYDLSGGSGGSGDSDDDANVDEVHRIGVTVAYIALWLVLCCIFVKVMFCLIGTNQNPGLLRKCFEPQWWESMCGTRVVPAGPPSVPDVAGPDRVTQLNGFDCDSVVVVDAAAAAAAAADEDPPPKFTTGFGEASI